MAGLDTRKRQNAAMKLEDFRLGSEFDHGGKRWRCTDVGTRTVVAMALEPHADPTRYAGPPYVVAETVFDEFEQCGCTPVEPTTTDPTGKVRYLRKERAARADPAKGEGVLDGVPDVSSVPRDEL
jgi:hypothetical protein